MGDSLVPMATELVGLYLRSAIIASITFIRSSLPSETMNCLRRRSVMLCSEVAARFGPCLSVTFISFFSVSRSRAVMIVFV